MKKLFVLLVIALSAIGASGQVTYVLDKNTCQDEVNASSPFTFISNGKTFTVKSSNEGKKLGFGAKNGLDEGVKYSSNDYTITIPDDVNIVSITFKGYTNDNSTPSFLVVNDTSHKEDLFEVRKNTKETVLKEFTYSIASGTKEIVFKPSPKQIVAVITLTESITATVGTAGYATFCTTATCKVPSGLTAYTAAYNATSGKVDLTEVTDGIIPANNGVILKGEAKEYTMETATSEVTKLAGNQLVGLTEKKDVTEADNIYILVKDGGVVKFGKSASGTIAAAAHFARLQIQPVLISHDRFRRVHGREGVFGTESCVILHRILEALLFGILLPVLGPVGKGVVVVARRNAYLCRIALHVGSASRSITVV